MSDQENITEIKNEIASIERRLDRLEGRGVGIWRFVNKMLERETNDQISSCDCLEDRLKIVGETCPKCEHETKLHDIPCNDARRTSLNSPLSRNVVDYIYKNPGCSKKTIEKLFQSRGWNAVEHVVACGNNFYSNSSYYGDTSVNALVSITYGTNFRDATLQASPDVRNLLDSFGENSVGYGCTGTKKKLVRCSCIMDLSDIKTATGKTFYLNRKSDETGSCPGCQHAISGHFERKSGLTYLCKEKIPGN